MAYDKRRKDKGRKISSTEDESDQESTNNTKQEGGVRKKEEDPKLLGTKSKVEEQGPSDGRDGPCIRKHSREPVKAPKPRTILQSVPLKELSEENQLEQLKNMSEEGKRAAWMALKPSFEVATGKSSKSEGKSQMSGGKTSEGKKRDAGRGSQVEGGTGGKLQGEKGKDVGSKTQVEKGKEVGGKPPVKKGKEVCSKPQIEKKRESDSTPQVGKEKGDREKSKVNVSYLKPGLWVGPSSDELKPSPFVNLGKRCTVEVESEGKGSLQGEIEVKRVRKEEPEEGFSGQTERGTRYCESVVTEERSTTLVALPTQEYQELIRACRIILAADAKEVIGRINRP